jgi:hypothetical protein
MSFHMMVFGDSLAWGQGLRDPDKFYRQVQRHVASLVETPVVPHLYAHSGAVIGPIDQDVRPRLRGEVPCQYPSVTAQFVRAKYELGPLITSEACCLVLISAGINDADLLDMLLGRDPALQDPIAHIHNRIDAFLAPRMRMLLQDMVDTFHNAFVVVAGYFPILSSQSFPRLIQDHLQLVLPTPPPPTDVLVGMCGAFLQLSTEALRHAVDLANRSLDKKVPRVFFAESGFTSSNALFAPSSFLWNGNDDPLYAERSQNYTDAVQLGMEAGPPWTPLASFGHPNLAGTDAYAKAIKAQVDLFKNRLVPSEPRVCDPIHTAIAERQTTIATLRQQLSGLNPRDPADRPEITQIRSEIVVLEAEIDAQQQLLAQEGCLPW